MYGAIIPVPARRHPHQVLVAALLVLSGLFILFGGPQPGSVAAALPGLLVYVWAGVLAIGGALVVAAAIVGPHASLYLELIADPPLAIMCSVYSASAMMLAGPRAAVPAGIVLAAAFAFALRGIQVGRTLRALRRELEARP